MDKKKPSSARMRFLNNTVKRFSNGCPLCLRRTGSSSCSPGEVLAQCKRRHRHQEFLQFLNHIDQNVPEDLEVHLIIDNYCTHKHAKVKRWLARRPRYHVHFTPTYASWLNQVEIWFNIITQKAIRRGSFRSVRELVDRIHTFTDNYNTKSRPFVWTATTESILQKIQRLFNSISGT